MKIGVVGCGSLGGVIAGKLWAVYGDSVCVFIRNEHTAEKVRGTGLTIEDDGKTVVARPPVVSGPEALSEPLDLIILATKTTTLSQAAEAYLPALSSSGSFLTTQNGLVALDLADRYGGERVVAGTVMWGASMSEPGRCTITAHGPFVIGGIGGKPNTHVVICRQVLEPVFPVKISPDIRDVLWAKLTITASLTSLGAITGLRFGEMLKRRTIRRLILEVAEEVVRVGRATGVGFRHSDGVLDVNLLVGSGFPPRWLRDLLIRAIGLKHRRTESSMLASIQAGEPTEIDAVNGVVVKLGKKHGIETPVNAAIVAAIGELENSSHKPGPKSLERVLSATTYA